MTDPTETNIPAEHRPGAEWVLKDIDRSIDYRKKYYEYSGHDRHCIAGLQHFISTHVDCRSLRDPCQGRLDSSWNFYSLWCDDSFCMVEVLHLF